LICRGALFLLVISPFGLACSGGYGPQPSGMGGWYTTAGAAGSGAGPGTGGGTAGTGGTGRGGGFADTAGTSGASAAGTGGSAGNAGTTGGGGTAGTLSPIAPPACDAIGPEPTIPTACTTLLATKTLIDGSPSDETLDSPAIVAAIAACPAGQAVRLAADGDKTGFVSGPLSLKSGVSLWLDTGTTLFASHDPRDFDSSPGKCASNNTGNSSCKALINVTDPKGSGVVGAGTIDGRGGEVPTGSTYTWWELEDMYDGNLAAPRLIQVNFGTDFVLYNVTLKNAAKFHVVIDSTVGYRVWGITINTPADSPNTDGVDPSRAKNGVIAYTKITTGDDNIAVKGGGPSPVDGLLVAHNHFGRGHGMSIGSETNGGVRNVSVCDLSLDGTDNGLRIKSDSSRGGLVQGIYYTDVCIRDSRHPLVFDSYYSSATGTLIPDFRDISVNNVHVLGTGGIDTFRGWDAAHPIGITLNNVVFDEAPTSIKAQYSNLTFGPQAVNIQPGGTGVTVTDQVTGAAAPRDCSNAWVTF
jgi:polygalacturonase